MHMHALYAYITDAMPFCKALGSSRLAVCQKEFAHALDNLLAMHVHCSLGSWALHLTLAELLAAFISD